MSQNLTTHAGALHNDKPQPSPAAPLASVKQMKKRVGIRDEKLEPNEYTRALAALKVQDHDLDMFARYFGLTLERDTERVSVLVELLERLKAAARSHAVDVECVIDHIQDRLFIECDSGALAASAFLNKAGKNTATAFERVLGP